MLNIINPIQLDAARAVIAGLAEDHIRAELVEVAKRADVERAVREYASAGVPIDTLSEASGLTVSDIRERVLPSLDLEDDLAALAGHR